MTPVGIQEIAELIGERRQTVSQWRARGKLPEPRWTVSGQPAWEKAQIERWWASAKR